MYCDPNMDHVDEYERFRLREVRTPEVWIDASP